MNIILEYSVQVKVPKFTTYNTKFYGWPKPNLFHSFLSPNCTFSVHICLTSAGLEFRDDKSRYIVIIKGRFMNISGWPEITKNGLLPLSLKSNSLWKKPAIHHHLGYIWNNIKPVSKVNSICPVGFINKGNTCYANSIWHVLSVMPLLWNRVPSVSNQLSSHVMSY